MQDSPFYFNSQSQSWIPIHEAAVLGYVQLHYAVGDDPIDSKAYVENVAQKVAYHTQVESFLVRSVVDKRKNETVDITTALQHKLIQVTPERVTLQNKTKSIC